MADPLTSLLGFGGLAASAYLPYSNSGEQIDYLKGQIPQYVSQAEDITNRAVQAAQFTPFTVKTGTGTTSIGAGGAMEQQLGGAAAGIQQGLLGQAQNLAGATINADPYQQFSAQALQQAQGMLGQPTATAGDIYSQLQASQQGELERQRMQLENRLAAQGRLGVTTSAYGGTPEQLAMEKAAQERSAANWLQSQTLAQQLAQQQTANAGSMFGLGAQAAAQPAALQGQNLANTMAAIQAGYAPQAQELAALQATSPFSQLATSAALSQAEQLSAGGKYGLEALATGGQTIAGLEGSRVNALANALSGMFSATGQATTSPFESLVAALQGSTTTTGG